MAQQAKRDLSDRYIKTRKAAAKGARDLTPDGEVRGLALRVTDSGHKSFVLVARYPGTKPSPSTGKLNPIPRTLGDYGDMSLEEAREKARQWRKLIKDGIDPRQHEAEARKAEQRNRTNSFGAVAEDFIKIRLAMQRRGRVSEREVRREMIPRWGDKPVSSLTQDDVRAMALSIADRGARRQALNLLSLAKALFAWAYERRTTYGLIANPAAGIKPATLIGKKNVRTRVLDDEELRRIWRAAGELRYPYGPLFRLLILTGQREADVAGARWSEIDLERRLWIIPSERFKAEQTQPVPLSQEAIAILASLPTFEGGDHLFSTTAGLKPVNGWSKAKARLDKEAGAMPHWVIHDLRRTTRTRLSALTADPIAELAIGHGKKGLARVYDQHKYLDEIRTAFEKWASALTAIVEPPPPNVVRLRGKA